MPQEVIEPEPQTREEKRVEELWDRFDRAFWRATRGFLMDLFVATVVGIIITFLIFVFGFLIEKAQIP